MKHPMYSDEYLEFIKWRKEQGFNDSFTRNQYMFIQSVLVESSKIGALFNLLPIVYQFKTSSNGNKT